MENYLGDFHLKWSIIYLDDIIIFSKMLEKHIKHLRSVFKKLSKAGLVKVLSFIENTMAHHLTSMEEDEDEEDADEHFPTASLDDNVWMEEPLPDRHLCIHVNSQHDLCPYPCPYSLNQLHLTPNDTPTVHGPQ